MVLQIGGATFVSSSQIFYSLIVKKHYTRSTILVLRRCKMVYMVKIIYLTSI
jgi:hypothetical protein